MNTMAGATATACFPVSSRHGQQPIENDARFVDALIQFNQDMKACGIDLIILPPPPAAANSHQLVDGTCQ